jgi:hypothetical protein
VVQKDPSARFDYLFEDPSEADQDIGYEDLGYEGHRLDVRRDPAPWYGTTPAVLALGAIVIAVIAILVSAVLLASAQSRGRGNHVVPPATSTTATAPSGTPSSSPGTSASVPPPATPPSPTASAAQIAVPTSPPQTPAPPPPTNNTHGPITRAPMSVAPAPHRAFPRY